MSRFDSNEFVPAPRRKQRQLLEGELAYLDGGARHKHPVIVLRFRGRDAWVQFMVGGSVWRVSTNRLER